MKTLICGIYKITSPTGKIYIGQSKNCTQRKLDYERGHCRHQLRIYRSIKKHGWDNHTFEIINQCKEQELNNLESYYIQLFNSFDSEYGMNLMSGGNCSQHSQESMEKIRYAATNISDETRKKRSNTMMGVKHSETRKKNSSDGHKYGKLPTAKMVFNSEWGIFYRTTNEAWQSYGRHSLQVFQAKLKGTYKNNTPYILV